MASSEIARRFSYSPDYVSRLAREGKIVASNVNRKWFIDVDSFTEFQQSTKEEKKQRIEKLQTFRQKERKLYLQKKVQEEKQEKKQVYIAMAQSFAMFACFIFIGMLGWVTLDTNMSMNDISFGFKQTAQQIFQVTYMGFKNLDISNVEHTLYSMEASVHQSGE